MERRGNFVRNDGQFAEGIRYAAKIGAGIAHLRDTQIDLYLAVDEQPIRLPVGYEHGPKSQPILRKISICFEGVDGEPALERDGSIQSPPAIYIAWRQPERKSIAAEQSPAVRYMDVWDGIDVKVAAADGGIEWDFEIPAGADPSRIAFRVVGEVDIEQLDPTELKIEFPNRVSYRLRFPQSFSIPNDGNREPVSIRSRLHEKSRVSFEVDRWNGLDPIVIDPQVVPESPRFTYFGGGWTEFCLDSARTLLGSTAVVGCTVSSDLPTQNNSGVLPYQDSYSAGFDGFVALFDTNLELVWSTYLSGDPTSDPLNKQFDIIRAIDFDPSGRAYLAAFTSSMNFPDQPVSPAGALVAQTFFGGIYGDCVVLRLESAGTAVGYVAYLSGSRWDVPQDIKVDPIGNAYVTGFTGSTTVTAQPFGFPVTAGCVEPISNIQNGAAGFVSKIDPAGANLVYSTFVGLGNASASSSFFDVGVVPFALALDYDEVDPTRTSVVVAGSTFSDQMLLTPNAFQSTFGGGATDAFVMKLNPSGSGYAFATLFGGSGDDAVNDVGVFPNHDIVVAGTTNSSDLPLATSFQSAIAGGRDAFVAKFDPSAGSSLSTLKLSSYFGGAGDEDVWALANDTARNFYVVGATTSGPSFPIVGPLLQAAPNPPGLRDGFVIRVGNTTLQSAQRVGGSGADELVDIGIDSAGFVLCGVTLSTDLGLYFSAATPSTSLTVLAPATTTSATSAGPFAIQPKWDVDATDPDGNAIQNFVHGLDTFLIKAGHP